MVFTHTYTIIIQQHHSKIIKRKSETNISGKAHSARTFIQLQDARTYCTIDITRLESALTETHHHE